MVIAVILVVCVVYTSSALADQNQTEENFHVPGTKITESLKGSFDQKFLIDHRKYDEPGEDVTFKERSDEDFNYAYPEEVQLVPQVPVTPDSPKYTLVPIKNIKVAQAKPTEAQQDDVLTIGPTIPSDFEEEIAKIQIPHLGLPGFITDPPPRNEEYEDEEDEEDGEGEVDNDEVPNNDHFFTNEFLEPPEFRDTVPPTRAQPVTKITHDRSRDIQFIIRNRPDPKKPLIIATSFPLYATNERFKPEGEKNGDTDEFRQMFGFTSVKSEHEVAESPGLHPAPLRSPQLRPTFTHYGPPKPVLVRPAYPPMPAYPTFVRRPSMPVLQSRRVVVRYPRQYRTYYQLPTPRYKRVQVLTQNYVKHPRNYYRNRLPSMMSTPQLRNMKTPGKKKKKKKIKGECKPKKIIKEIHFHHYDPQLSAQLAPLEGINFREGEDYEHDIKVITKETEIKDEVQKGHEDYEQHNENLEKEMEKHKEETMQRLTHPERYSASYNPRYPEESVEYIDYNIKTDSETSIHEPHPAHEYPDERSFNAQISSNKLGATSSSSLQRSSRKLGVTPTPSLQGSARKLGVTPTPSLQGSARKLGVTPTPSLQRSARKLGVTPTPSLQRSSRKLGVTPTQNNTTKPYTSPTPLVGGRYVKHRIIKYYYETPNSKES